eukprot:SAG31_NODE_8294_length_1479_cov_1.681159_3_plen_267_part_00
MPRGFVSLELPADGSAARTTLLCAVEQDTGSSEGYAPALGYDPNAMVRGMNDGKCDRAGRFWAGSVLTPKGMKQLPTGSPGSLWRLGAGAKAELVLEACGCAQGPAWSPDNKTMYWTDSQKGVIEAFDFDLVSGSISNRRTFCEDFGALPRDEKGLPAGGPDGLTVDSEGMVWSAIWGAGKVVRLHPDTGEIVATVVTPGVDRASSVMFGGPDMRTLFITTCSRDFGEIEMEPLPAPAGSLFAIHLDFAIGLPEPAYNNEGASFAK